MNMCKLRRPWKNFNFAKCAQLSKKTAILFPSAHAWRALASSWDDPPRWVVHCQAPVLSNFITKMSGLPALVWPSKSFPVCPATIGLSDESIWVGRASEGPAEKTVTTKPSWPLRVPHGTTWKANKESSPWTLAWHVYYYQTMGAELICAFLGCNFGSFWGYFLSDSMLLARFLGICKVLHFMSVICLFFGILDLYNMLFDGSSNISGIFSVVCDFNFSLVFAMFCTCWS